MQTKIKQGCVKLPTTKRQWKLYQNLNAVAEGMNRLADAQEVRKDKPRSVPLELLPMVF